jgi:lipid-A-disaccharide synthase-like uncharacterized protein
MPDAAAWLHETFVAQFDGWVALGLLGQSMFFFRFLIQWLASEKARRSVVPVQFWFYALNKQEPVLIIGQIAGMFVYARNLWLIFRERRSALAVTE